VTPLPSRFGASSRGSLRDPRLTSRSTLLRRVTPSQTEGLGHHSFGVVESLSFGECRESKPFGATTPSEW
jgi:hypothetical protein